MIAPARREGTSVVTSNALITLDDLRGILHDVTAVTGKGDPLLVVRLDGAVEAVPSHGSVVVHTCDRHPHGTSRSRAAGALRSVRRDIPRLGYASAPGSA